MSDSYGKSTAIQKTLLDRHLRLLLWLGILLRVLVATLAFLASYLPAFDSSPSILLEDASESFYKRWVATFFRWDAFHFLHITDEAYVFEHEWAFFPGVPGLAGVSEFILTRLRFPHSIYTRLFGHYLLSIFLTPVTAQTLYHLTLKHTKSPGYSFLSACLSLIPSSPATSALAPYTEPWVAFLSYKGMLYCADKRWLKAAALFSLAGMFRSNSIFLAGFIVWGIVIEPLLTKRQIKMSTILLCICLSIFPCLPFVGVQMAGYNKLCIHATSVPSWCTRRLPLVYGHVQSHYWDVGFLRYWTLQQLPNFLLAAPVLLLLLYSSAKQILYTSLSLQASLSAPPPQPLLASSTLPHAIHAFIITCILLFASHTQIILRLASSMPFTYWSAARLFSEHPKWARAWVTWSVVWGSMSVVLWTTFLPPA